MLVLVHIAFDLIKYIAYALDFGRCHILQRRLQICCASLNPRFCERHTAAE